MTQTPDGLNTAPLSEHIQQRLAHEESLRQVGIAPYGSRFDRSHLVGEVHSLYRELPQEATGEEVSVAGRLIALREHGKASFGNILDISGDIQIYLKLNLVGEAVYSLLKLVDIGDILGVRGKVFRTRKGELTIAVEELRFLSKSLRPLPEKWHGLRDIEIRYRQRYVDLIANPEIRGTFLIRSRVIRAIRNLLDSKKFLEVETPIMTPLAGGATARPFVTYHNTLETELFLRIATELYLKRCIVGGLEKVYEIGRIFRNEGISTRHNPEFTMLELYEAYADYEDMMRLTEEIVATSAREALGSPTCTFQGQTLNLDGPYPRLTMADALKKYGNIELSSLKDPQTALRTARELEIEVSEKDGVAHLMDKIFEAVVEPHLVQPTFITDYPIELSPLAKKREDNPDLTYRFELFIMNQEIANAFSELNDSRDQRKRFEEQMKLRAGGDEEAQVLDEDFIRALEYGMPPTGGMGMGIDRLVMLLTDNPCIRDVILFPLLKPRELE